MIFNLVDQEEFHPCQSTMPMYVKTFANSTLPLDSQVSETALKRHDKPAASSHSAINPQLSSQASSNSSDDVVSLMNGFGSVKRKGSKNKASLLTRGDKRATEKSLLWNQKTDSNSTRASAPSVLDTIKCATESSSTALSTGAIQTSALATNTKSTSSTLSSSKQTWIQGRGPTFSNVISITSRQPQAADVPDCSNNSSSSSSSSIATTPVPSNYALHKRRTSAPAFSSRMVSTGVNYAALVKANLPSTTTMAAQQPSSPINVTSPSVPHNSSSLNTSSTNSSSVLESGNTYASHVASSSSSKPLQEASRDYCNKTIGAQNLVAATESINIILQDLDSAAAMRKSTAGRKDKQSASGEVTTDQSNSSSSSEAVVDKSSDGDVLEQEWDNIDISTLSNECNTGELIVLQ